MKVIELLLMHLPETYVDRIVSNIPKEEMYSLYQESSDISAEMLSLFNWESSREGFEFWSDVLDCIQEGLALPPLPINIDYAPNTHLIINDDEWVVMNTGGLNINMRFQYQIKKLKEMNDQKKYEIFSSFVN